MATILLPHLGDVHWRPTVKAGAMKATLLSLALLVGCSSSPIKSVECTVEGVDKPEVITFDRTAGEVYEFDSFSEMLKPMTDFKKEDKNTTDELTSVITDSGKIKIRKLASDTYGPRAYQWRLEQTIDLNTMTYVQVEEESKSKLITIKYQWGDELKKALEHNLRVLDSGETDDIEIQQKIGTCKYVTPRSTTVFPEEVEQ